MSAVTGLHTALVSIGAAYLSSPAQRTALFGFLLITELRALWNFSSNGPIPLNDYITGTTIMTSLFNACDLLVLTPDPIASLRFRSEKDGAPVEPTFTSNLQKIWWTLVATLFPRAIHRVSQVANIPPFHESHVPSIFVRNRLTKFIFHTIPLLIVCRYTLLFTGRDARDWKYGFGRWAVVYTGGYMSYLGISAPYMVLSMLAVSLKISKPADWPQLFGSWTHINTLRGFWGKTWHQMLRKMVSSFGDTLAQRILRFPSGSSRSSYTKLYTAFTLSALLHSAGDFALTHGIYWFSWKFFLLQAVGITFEDGVIAVWKRTGLGRNSTGAWIGKWIGYAWTTAWFTMTYPIMMGGFVTAFEIRAQRLKL